jgi:hypothetical protein
MHAPPPDALINVRGLSMLLPPSSRNRNILAYANLRKAHIRTDFYVSAHFSYRDDALLERPGTFLDQVVIAIAANAPNS